MRSLDILKRLFIHLKKIERVSLSKTQLTFDQVINMKSRDNLKLYISTFTSLMTTRALSFGTQTLKSSTTSCLI